VNYQFIEFQNVGFNPATISSIGIVILSITQGWGLWEQNRTIVKNDSSKSIAVMSYAYFSAHYLAFSIYGYHQKSLAMILNGLLGFMFIANYISTVKTKDHGAWKKWHVFFVVLIPLMMFAPEPKKAFYFMLVFACILGTQVPAEIYIKKDSGSVEPKFIATLAVSTSFWSVFSWTIKDMPLFYANTYTLFLMIVTLFFWHRYCPRTKALLLEELRALEMTPCTVEASSDEFVEELSEIGILNPELGGVEIGLCPSIGEYNRNRIRIIRQRLNMPA
jgi:uncharacterized protein with PQ loop repeat